MAEAEKAEQTGSEFTCDNVAICGTPTTALLTSPPVGWFIGQGGIVGNPSKQRVLCPGCTTAAGAAVPALIS